jgi:hypothetical protein
MDHGPNTRTNKTATRENKKVLLHLFNASSRSQRHATRASRRFLLSPCNLLWSSPIVLISVFSELACSKRHLESKNERTCTKGHSFSGYRHTLIFVTCSNCFLAIAIRWLHFIEALPGHIKIDMPRRESRRLFTITNGSKRTEGGKRRGFRWLGAFHRDALAHCFLCARNATNCI